MFGCCVADNPTWTLRTDCCDSLQNCWCPHQHHLAPQARVNQLNQRLKPRLKLGLRGWCICILTVVLEVNPDWQIPQVTTYLSIELIELRFRGAIKAEK